MLSLSTSEVAQRWTQSTVGYFSAGVVDLGPDQEICPGSTLLLNATTPGATYLWQDGSSASTFTADASGTYWVLVNVSGCTDQDSIDVNVTAIPQPDLRARWNVL